MAQWNAWMTEYPVPGKPFKCYVEEDTKCPILYFKDAALSADLVYQAPKEQIKTMNYNVTGVVPTRTAKDIEQVVKEHVPGARISYNPDQKVMAYFRRPHGRV